MITKISLIDNIDEEEEKKKKLLGSNFGGNWGISDLVKPEKETEEEKPFKIAKIKPITEPVEIPSSQYGISDLNKPEQMGKIQKGAIGIFGTWEAKKKAMPELQGMEDFGTEVFKQGDERSQIAYIQEALTGTPKEETLKELQANWDKFKDINPDIDERTWKEYYKQEGFWKTLITGPSKGKYDEAIKLRNQLIDIAQKVAEPGKDIIGQLGWSGMVAILGAEAVAGIMSVSPIIKEKLLNKTIKTNVSTEKSFKALQDISGRGGTTEQMKLFRTIIAQAKAKGVSVSDVIRKGVTTTETVPRFAFAGKLYAGLPADEIAKSIIEVGKVTAEAVKGLDPVKVSQVTQALLNTSPALASEFLKAVEKPEGIPEPPKVTPPAEPKEVLKAEVKEPSFEKILKGEEEVPVKIDKKIRDILDKDKELLKIHKQYTETTMPNILGSGDKSLLGKESELYAKKYNELLKEELKATPKLPTFTEEEKPIYQAKPTPEAVKGEILKAEVKEPIKVNIGDKVKFKQLYADIPEGTEAEVTKVTIPEKGQPTIGLDFGKNLSGQKIIRKYIPLDVLEISKATPKAPAIPTELEGLAEEAKKAKDVDTFIDTVSQDNLMDLSDPTKHRWGRAIPQTADEAVDTVASIEKNPKGYLEDIRLSTPDTYNAIMRGDKNVTIYRAVPPTKEQMITFFEGELSKLMQYGGRRTYPFAQQLGFSPSKTMSDYYKYLSDELPKIKSGESRFTGITENKLGIGDYVALDRSYVKMHGESVLVGQQKYPTYKIVSKTVPKTDVIWGQADFNEWVYSPQKTRDKIGNLTDFYTQATAGKAGVAVTEKPAVVAPVAEKAIPAPAKAEVKFEPKIELATPAQINKAYSIAKSKAMVSEEGKLKPQFRKIAEIFTGVKYIEKMTPEQAEMFIDQLNRLPEPKYRNGKLVPPSIPTTTKLTIQGFFQKKYGEPTPIWLLTDQTYYATKLGIKPLVAPFEKGKQEFDLEFRKSSNLVDRMANKLNQVAKTPGWERVKSKIKNIPTKAEANMASLLNKHEVTPTGLSPKEEDVFKYFRNLSKDIWRRENEVREKLDLPPIKYKTAYFRHTADAMAKEMLEGKYPFPQGIKYWSEKIVGKKIFNPMEFHRRLSDDLIKLWSKDIRAVTKAMLWNGLKEIHLAQPAKFLSEQLNAISKDLPEYKNLTPSEQKAYDQTEVIPASTKKWMIDYVNQVLKGQETELDASLNRIVTKSGLKGIFDKVLSPFGRTIGRTPITHLFSLSGRMIISGVMGWVPRQMIRNAWQQVQNLALYGVNSTLKAFLPASIDKNLKGLLTESLFMKSYTGFEELPVDLMGKLEKIWLQPYGIVAVNNAKQGMKAAYWNILELIKNPKFKKYGWADPQRTKDTPKGFLYPSEKEKLLKEMEFGSSCTQYQYIPMGMPGIFRYKALIPLTRLQSWWMNYFTKFNREAFHRLRKGETSYGAKLPWSRRVNWAKYLIIGGAILTALGYKKSFMLGVAPRSLSPAGQLGLGFYNYTIADSDWQKKRALNQIYYSWKAFIPGSLAWRDFLAVWNGEKDLEEILFYGKKEEKKPEAITIGKPSVSKITIPKINKIKINKISPVKVSF